ncbi:MAG: hypothetical protein PF489_13490 [Salinivirgaceae bacterium]|nr:hypothetical protein [Salinivirgaceae bacterium]
MNITQLCKEIRELEARLQNLSISDTIMIRKEIEYELGERYNKLMSWADINDVEEIQNGFLHIRKKIKM